MWKLAVVLLGLVCVSYQTPLKFNFETEFQNFVQQHSRTYKDDAERTMRYNTFVENMNEMLEDQKNMPSAKFGVTKYADWTKEEKKQLLGVRPKKAVSKTQKSAVHVTGANHTVPTAFDWRSRNVITPVKDQGQCGSCWTFQTIALTESRVLLNGKKEVLLSEQEIVDCDHLDESDGCNGGWPNAGLEYVEENGVTTEKNYPYKAVNQKCHAKYNTSERVSIKSWAYLGPDENTAQYTLTQTGPLGYDIWVPNSLFNYVSGVYNPTVAQCTTAQKSEEGHAITIVGFGTDGGLDYWIIKNSWGLTWGESGYFRMIRGALSNGCAMGYGIGDTSGDFGDGNEWFVVVTA